MDVNSQQHVKYFFENMLHGLVSDDEGLDE